MDELNDREGGPPRRKGIPRWAWFTCGTGCLLAAVTAAVLGIAAFRAYERGADPEQQWPRLAQILPFDERPASIELFGFSFAKNEQFHLRDTRSGLQAIVLALPTREHVEEHVSTDPQTVFGMGKPVDPEQGEIELQGKSVSCVRFSSIKGQGDLGPGLRIDLGSYAGKHRAAELHAPRSSSPPSDDEVRAFFEPFDLWRER